MVGTTLPAVVRVVDLPVAGPVTGAELIEAVQTSAGVGQSVQLPLSQVFTSIGGLPPAGGTGQILNKLNSNNYSAQWSDITQFVAVGTSLATTGSATSIVAFVPNQGITSTQIANNAVGTNQIASSLGIASSLSIGTLLTVGGTATFNGTAIFNATAIYANGLNVTGTTLITGTFGVVGTSQFTGAFNVAGTSVVTGTLGVIGTTLFTSGTFGVVGTTQFTSGAFGVVATTVNVVGTTIGITGTTLITGTFGVAGTTLHTGLFTVVGTSSFTGGNFNVLGTALFTSGTFGVVGTSTFTGVHGVIGTTLFTSGNFGVVGTSLFTSGAFGVVGTSSFTSGLFGISGTTLATGQFGIVGSTVVTGTLNVSGTATLTGTIIFPALTSGFLQVSATGVVGTTTPGNFVLLNTLSPNGVATTGDNTSLTSTYRNYMITFENITPATNASFFQMQIATSGTAFVSGGYISQYDYPIGGVGATGDTSTTVFLLTGTRATTSVWSSPLYGVAGSIKIFNPAGTVARKQIVGETGYMSNASAATSNLIIGFPQGYFDGNSNAWTAIQFSFNTGNIATGTIKIYGMT